jgi:prepilin-type N-terminal cleavage/methylation domain-containing protein
MRKKVVNSPEKKRTLSSASGFSVLELLIVVALIAIVSAFALINFQKSNRSLRVAGATRTLSTYLEKARVDAERRHGVASVVINSRTSYTVNVDFNGTGTTTARTITLPAGTTLSYSLPPAATSINPTSTPRTIAYDWRGRTTDIVLLTLTDSTSGVMSGTVVVGTPGDISTDTAVTGPATTLSPLNTTETTTTGIKSMH